jgi:hypothetical protein
MGDQEEIDLLELDNNVVYMIDSRKPGKEPVPLSLGNCYFPTRVVYDEASQYLYVRGTEYLVGDEENTERQVIVKLRVSLDEDGKPFMSERPVSFTIPSEDGGDAVDAPSEFFLAYGGSILILTNGYSVYTYNVVDGYKYPVLFPGDRITSFDYEEVSNTVTLAFTRQEEREDGSIRYSTEVRFYRLRENGNLDLIRGVPREHFPDELALMEGSTVALSVNAESKVPEFGFFIGRDGSVCQIDLRVPDGAGKADGVVDVLGIVPELAVGDSEVVSGREVSYNRARRLLTAIKKGVKWDVRRPSFVRVGRPRVRRPSFVRLHEPPVLVVIQFNKKNKIVDVRAISDEFAEKEGLSNLMFEGDEGFIVAQTGELYSMDFTDISRLQPRVIGNVGLRVERIGKGLGQVNFVGVSSFRPGEDVESSANGEGALVLVKVKAENVP